MHYYLYIMTTWLSVRGSVAAAGERRMPLHAMQEEETR